MTLPSLLNFEPVKQADDILEFDNGEQEQIFNVITDNQGASYGEVSRLAGLQGSRPTNNQKVKNVIVKFGLEHCKIGDKFCG